MDSGYCTMDKIKKNLRERRIKKAIYIAKIISHTEIVLGMNTVISPYLKNALANLAEILFCAHTNDAFSQLHKYMCFPPVHGSSSAKKRDYILEIYSVLSQYGDSENDVEAVRNLEEKFHTLRNLISPVI